MTLERIDRLRTVLRLILILIYAAGGVLHLVAADALTTIMPPGIPFPRAVVLFTGVCELAGAAGLMIPRVRWLAGLMLAIYALCVWPANIYQALWHVPAPPLPDSWWYHGPRLAFQPVLMWWALLAGGVTDWPLRARAGKTSTPR